MATHIISKLVLFFAVHLTTMLSYETFIHIQVSKIIVAICLTVRGLHKFPLYLRQQYAELTLIYGGLLLAW